MTSSLDVPDPSLPRLEPLRERYPDVLVALDFDGPIAPIVDDPDRSRPVADAVCTLTGLAEDGAQVAIVTGRDVETLLRLSGLGDVPNLVVLGVHGAQRWEDGVTTQVEQPAAMRRLRDDLPEVVDDIDPGLWIEDKDLSLVVHARRAEDPKAALRALRAELSSSDKTHGFTLHEGKMILELRIPGIDKGTALSRLLQETLPGAALFAGDDHGDLPGFAALREWSERTGRPSVSIAVGDFGSAREEADLHCEDAHALIALLGTVRRTADSVGGGPTGP